MLSNPKTTIAGYLATAAGIAALLSQSLPPRLSALFIIVGQVANGLGNVMAKDGGH